ncbi:MAG: DUF3987 domain-containing protein [Planctomycetota bacterium]
MTIDPSVIALSSLTTLAATIGNAAQIEIKTGYRQPSALWVAIVAPSGSAKSSAMECAVCPLRDLEGKPVAEGTGSDQRRRVIDDATPEAVLELLKSNPNGLLMFGDELSGTMDFSRYKQGKSAGDTAAWLRMHDAASITVDRIEKTVQIPNACVSILGGIQPKVFTRTMGGQHEDNGMLARFICVEPPIQPRYWTDASLDPDLFDQYAGLIGRLAYLPKHTEPLAGSVSRILTLSAGAKELLVPFVNEIAAIGLTARDSISAFTNKLSGITGRIGLVIELATWAQHNTNEVPEVISAESMDSAVEIGRWALDEYRRVVGRMAGIRAETEVEAVVAAVRKLGGSATVAELAKTKQGWRGRNHHIESHLDLAVEAGHGCWVAQEPGTGGGRPTRRFVLRDTESP